MCQSFLAALPWKVETVTIKPNIKIIYCVIAFPLTRDYEL